MKHDNNPQITQTWVGQEYGWDYVSDVNYNMLKQNLDSALKVVDDPDRFPRADFEGIRRKIYAITLFLTLYPRR